MQFAMRDTGDVRSYTLSLQQSASIAERGLRLASAPLRSSCGFGISRKVPHKLSVTYGNTALHLLQPISSPWARDCLGLGSRTELDRRVRRMGLEQEKALCSWILPATPSSVLAKAPREANLDGRDASPREKRDLNSFDFLHFTRGSHLTRQSTRFVCTVLQLHR
jgi:hypothetical protein